MKILSITIENIQSIAAKTTIHFDGTPFSEEGIFLICGPTGSGKSTILDAINLALFKETPRTGGKITAPSINEQGMVITRGAISATAEIIYEMDAKNRFKSEFKADRTARSQGFNSAHLKMTLMKWVGEKWELITDKDKEVVAENTANIGLDANQFRMAVMLAQGDFAKLLKAEATERAQLLEKITGKTLFRSLGKKISEKFLAKKKEIESAEIALGSIALLTDEEKEKLVQSLTEIQQSISALEEVIQQNRKEVLWWENHRELQSKKEKQVQLLQKKRELEHRFSAVSEAYDRHEKAERFIPILQQRSRLIENIAFQTNQSIQLEEEKNRLHQEITEIRSNIESLKPNFLTQTDWLNELEQKKLLAQSGKEKIQTLQTELEQRKRSIADLVGRWNWSFETPTATWKSWKSETELLFKRMNITVEEVEKEVLLCSQQKQNAQQWLESEKQLELKRNQITQNESSQKTLANEIQEIAQQLQGPSMELELAQKQGEAAQLEVEGLQKIADASQIRATLVEGQPCVVCGSLEHPFAHQPFDDALQKKTEEREGWNRKCVDLTQIVAQLQNKERELNQKMAVFGGQLETLKDDELSLLGKLKQQKIEGFESAQSAINHFQTQGEQLQSAREKVEQYQQLERAEPIFQQIPPLQEKLELATQSYFQQFPSNFLGVVDGWINAVSSKKEQLSNNQEKQEKTSNALSDGQKDLMNLEKSILSEIRKVGFSTLEETESSWIKGEEIKEWRGWKTEMESQLPLLRDLENEITRREAAQANQPQPAQTEEESKQVLLGRETELKEKLIHQGNIQTEIKTEQSKREQAGSKLEEIQTLKAEFQHWNVLNTAFGDANGDRFSKIAQQYTLDLLIQIANKKLGDFKARYILQQEKHPKGDSHLVVVDQYLGNQIRSVDTLSGGEMFLTSLALAMALSEFAAQNAQLNTLFIDEGFGTLDPDSLNAAMEAIDAVRQQSKKMIGLISHVQELRERIHCQIELKPKGNGQSTIEIRPQST